MGNNSEKGRTKSKTKILSFIDSIAPGEQAKERGQFPQETENEGARRRNKKTEGQIDWMSKLAGKKCMPRAARAAREEEKGEGEVSMVGKKN